MVILPFHLHQYDLLELTAFLGLEALPDKKSSHKILEYIWIIYLRISSIGMMNAKILFSALIQRSKDLQLNSIHFYSGTSPT